MGTHVAETRSRYTTEDEDFPRQHGRRAAQPVDSPTAIAVADPATAGLRRLAVPTLAAGLLVASMSMAHAAAPKQTHSAIAEVPTTGELEALVQASVTAPDVELSQETVTVNTQAAPVVQKPVPVAKPVVQAKTQVVAESAQAPAPAVTAAPVAAAPAPVNSSRAEMIVNAALSQVGQYQDCTMLVTRSLAAVGINFHDWPAGYKSLGTLVPLSEAMPGDLLYYVNGAGTSVAGMAHIAVYIGNGKAVHGGFNVNETVVWSWNVGYNPAVAPSAVIRLR